MLLYTFHLIYYILQYLPTYSFMLNCLAGPSNRESHLTIYTNQHTVALCYHWCQTCITCVEGAVCISRHMYLKDLVEIWHECSFPLQLFDIYYIPSSLPLSFVHVVRWVYTVYKSNLFFPTWLNLLYSSGSMKDKETGNRSNNSDFHPYLLNILAYTYY